MDSRSDPLASAVALILAEVSGWPGVSLAPHRFGGTAFQLGRGELGHVHPNGLLDIAFPKPVRDELVASHRVEPHHVLPESGWVTFRLHGDADVAPALDLLRLARDARGESGRKRARPEESPGGGTVEPSRGESPREAALDEAIEESFPASDPPAAHGDGGGS